MRRGKIRNQRYGVAGARGSKPVRAANLDEGALWPVAFALTQLTAAEEARIGALVKKAVS